MKTFSLIVFVAVLVGVLIWLFGRVPADPVDEQAVLDTDVSVHSAPIIRTTLRGYLTAYGNVAAEPAGERPAASARIATPTAGVVAAVFVTEGQQIAKGTLMVELDSRAADVSVAFARKTLERQQQLVQAGGTSPKSLQQAQQQLDDALVQQSLLRIPAPLSGTVTRLNVRPGEAVDLTTVVAEVVDLNRLVVNAAVPDAHWSALRIDQPAQIFTGNASAPSEGHLSYISADVDVSTGTVPVRIALPADCGLRPGQFVSVRIVTTEHTDVLAVPLASISTNEKGEKVISVINNNIAVRQPVSTGLSDGDLVEISAPGIQAGMQVVTQGAYALPGETRVNVIEH